uniref:Uncharacterized protein n=1 Tax=Rhizophora mucronata TaxID=61149 RepID=A0A2P2M3K8_RHIMU
MTPSLLSCPSSFAEYLIRSLDSINPNNSPLFVSIVPYPFQTFLLSTQNQQVEEEEMSIWLARVPIHYP